MRKITVSRIGKLPRNVNEKVDVTTFAQKMRKVDDIMGRYRNALRAVASE